MSTLANSNQKKRRLEGKDLITIGIYTVIYIHPIEANQTGQQYHLAYNIQG